jgi:hypothetical protein
LTGNNWGSQSCHILPSSAERNPDLYFWGALATFWSTDQVSELQEYLKKPEAQFSNLIMLDAGLHNAWTNARFALKPLPSNDVAEVALELHLLRNRSPGSIQHQQCNDPVDDHNYMAPVIDTRRGQPLQTGDVVHIRSSDPATYFLPDIELIRLQYHIQRVVQASVAAGPLTILFRDDRSPRPENTMACTKEEELEEEDATSAAHPVFCEFLIDEAVRLGIIRPDATDYWRDMLYGGSINAIDEENVDLDTEWISEESDVGAEPEDMAENHDVGGGGISDQV